MSILKDHIALEDNQAWALSIFTGRVARSDEPSFLDVGTALRGELCGDGGGKMDIVLDRKGICHVRHRYEP